MNVSTKTGVLKLALMQLMLHLNLKKIIPSQYLQNAIKLLLFMVAYTENSI